MNGLFAPKANFRRFFRNIMIFSIICFSIGMGWLCWHGHEVAPINQALVKAMQPDKNLVTQSHSNATETRYLVDSSKNINDSKKIDAVNISSKSEESSTDNKNYREATFLRKKFTGKQQRLNRLRNQRALRLKPPTQAELHLRRKTIPVPKNIKMTPLGLKRVNARREQKNMPVLDVQAVPVGREVETIIPGDLTVAELKIMTGPMLKSELVKARATGEAVFTAADLPVYVNNSTLKYFPPIGDQSASGTACAHFTSMYYQLTHMTAMVRDWDAKNDGEGYRFSPSFSFSQVERPWSWLYKAYDFALKHGAATWQEVPYSIGAPSTFPLSTWRNALNNRAMQWGRIPDIHTAAGLTKVKQYLVNGYVLGVSTYLYSWDVSIIKDDPSTSADDPFVGTAACKMVDERSYYHAMTIVGYHDDIWVDLNNNDVVDLGEKGAFRVANSFGTDGYGIRAQPYIWVAYDAMQKVSAVPGGPAHNTRRGVWEYNEACWITARASYTPLVLAEITLKHSKQDQLRVRLGIGDTTASTPSKTWLPSSLLRGHGGPSPVDGTFLLDFTDLVPPPGQTRRWFVGLGDSTAGDPATLTSFKLINVSDGTTVVCDNVPKVSDAGEALAWIDWTYNGTNTPPLITSAPSATPNPVRAGQAVAFSVTAMDAEQTRLSYSWTFGDGSRATGASVQHSYLNPGTFTANVIISDGQHAAASGTVTVDVNENEDPPHLLKSLLGVAVNEGQRALFCVDANGSLPLTYQWKRNGINISGATSRSYTTPNTSNTDNGAAFSVLVSNAFGQITSNDARLKVFSDGLLAHWKFDETSGGIAQDATGNGHVAHINSSTWTTRGKLNGALDMNTLITIRPLMVWEPSNRIPLTSDWTISGWFTLPLPHTVDGWHSMSSQYNVCNHIAISDTLDLGIYDGGTGGGMRSCGYNLKTLTAGWHHVTATGSGTHTKFYMDGVYVGTSDWNPASSFVEYLGGLGSTRIFSNKIDDVRVYNRELSAVEVSALVNAVASLSTQPADILVHVGQTAMFQVTATGIGPLSYQWRKNGTNIPGATSPSYTTPVTVTGDSGAKFSVRVSNATGGEISNEATLVLNSAAGTPVIITQPNGTKVNLGHPATFNVKAVGITALTFQWRKNGINISGATTATYTTPATVSADHASTFHVVVSNASGSVVSDDVTLTVKTAAPKIVTQPESIVVNKGEAATFSMVVSGTGPFTYSWKSSHDPLASTATGATYTTFLTNTEQNGALINCTVKNSAGSVTSAEAILIVLGPPSLFTQPANVLVLEGQAATFSVVMDDPAPYTISQPHTQPWIYQWRKNGINISGATGISYTAMAVTIGDSGALFSVVVSNAVGSVTSNDAVLMIQEGEEKNQAPELNSGPTATPTQPTVAQLVTFIASATDPDGDTLTFAWDFGNGATGAGNQVTHTYDEAGLYNVEVIVSDGNGGEVSGSIMVRVDPENNHTPGLVRLVARDQFDVDVPDTQIYIRETSTWYPAGTEVQLDVGSRYRLRAKVAGLTGPDFYHTITEAETEIVVPCWKAKVTAHDQFGIEKPGTTFTIQYHTGGSFPAGTDITLPKGRRAKIYFKISGISSNLTIVFTDGVEQIDLKMWTATLVARDQFGTDVVGATINVRYLEGTPFAPGRQVTVPMGYKAAVSGKVAGVTGPRKYIYFQDTLTEADPGFWTFTVRTRDQFGMMVPNGKAHLRYVTGEYFSDGTVLSVPKDDVIRTRSRRTNLYANSYDNVTFTDGVNTFEAKFRSVLFKAVATDGSTIVAGAEIELVSSQIARFANNTRQGVPVPDIVRVKVHKDGELIADLNPATFDEALDVLLIPTSHVAGTGNTNPVIESGPLATPNPAKMGEVISFHVGATDADLDTLSYLWNFGDGTASSGADSTHTYNTAGTFTVNVTVSDGNGGSALASFDVVVKDSVAPQIEVTTVLLKGVVNDDSDGVSLTVNGQSVAVQPDGSWEQDVPLDSATTLVQIEAKDGAGNVTTKTITIEK